MRTTYLRFMALGLLGVGSCKQGGGQGAGSCVKSEVGTTASGESSFAQPIAEIEALGGFVELRRDDKSLMCTAFVEVEEIPDGGDAQELPITIWTAKHCMWESMVNEAVLKLSTKNVKGEGGYVSMPVSLDLVEKMKKLRAITQNSAAYQSFASSFSKYAPRDRDFVYKLIVANVLGKGKDATVYTDTDAADDLFDKTVNFRKGLMDDHSERLAFGRPLCSDRRSMDNSGNSKVCFSHDDLGAYRGKLSLTVLTKDSTNAIFDRDFAARVVEAGRRQLERRATSAAKLGAAEKVSVESYTSKSAGGAGVAGKWKALYQNEYRLTTKLAYVEACGTSGCNPEDFSSVFDQGGDNIIAAAAGATMESLSQELAEELDDRGALWEAMAGNYFAQNVSSTTVWDTIFFHSNLKFKGGSVESNADAEYDSVPLSTLAPRPGTPMLWRRYGFVYWSGEGQDGFKIFKSDSGTVISLDGVIPVAVVSSVNNDPTSGGIPVSDLPEYSTGVRVASSDNYDNGDYVDESGVDSDQPAGGGNAPVASTEGGSGKNGLPGSSETAPQDGGNAEAVGLPAGNSGSAGGGSRASGGRPIPSSGDATSSSSGCT